MNMFHVQVLLLVSCIIASKGSVYISDSSAPIIVGVTGDVLIPCNGPSSVEWLQDGRLINTALDGYDASPPIDKSAYSKGHFNILRIDSTRKGNGGKFVCRDPANQADKSEVEVKVGTTEALRLSFPFKTDIACGDGIQLVCSSGKRDLNITWYLNGAQLDGGTKPVELLGQVKKVRKGQEFETHLRLEYGGIEEKSDYSPFIFALKDRTYTFYCRPNRFRPDGVESNHLSIFRGGASMVFIERTVVSVVTLLGFLVSYCQ